MLTGRWTSASGRSMIATCHLLQIQYATQACILNLKTYAMQASTWICTYQMQSNTSSWACSPYLCASLFQEFWSFSIPQCCFLFIHVRVQPLLLCLKSPKVFISLYNISPFVVNFHKRHASYWCKGLHWGRWLMLESCIFYGHHLYSSLDIMCRILWLWYQL